MDYRLNIKNHPAEIDRLIAAFEVLAEGNSVPRNTVMKLNIVFDELVSNIISYAYRDEDEHEIEVQMVIDESRLAVTVIDDGVPFNPLTVKAPDTDTSLEDRELGGMGIHLVRNLVDDVSYQRGVHKNALTLVILFASEEA